MKNHRELVFLFGDVLVVVVVVVVVDVVFAVLIVIIVLVFAGLGAVSEQGGTQFWFVCDLFRASSKARSNRTEQNNFDKHC